MAKVAAPYHATQGPHGARYRLRQWLPSIQNGRRRRCTGARYRSDSTIPLSVSYCQTICADTANPSTTLAERTSTRVQFIRHGILFGRAVPSRSPIDHLTELGGFLRPGGELVLETLVVPGDEHTVLVPADRYAKMSNVWFLPAVPMLETWLRRAGFVNIRTVDVDQTSILEQRRTDWMTFHSLEDFLDPADPNKTFEGYPAPRRAITIAEKPS
jgi:hypothetical protein